MSYKIRIILGTAVSFPLYTNKQEKREMVERVLKPLLKALVKHPQIAYTLSISGHVLDWCTKYHREYIQVIRQLIERKSLELLGGGYYDPIFPLISREDSIVHIEYASTSITKLYRRRPHGIWINQLMWDSALTGVLQKCGIDYTFLNDSDCVDYDDEEALPLCAPLITEHTGKSVEVFPINTRLLNLWNAHRLRACMTELRAIHDAPKQCHLNVVTLIDGSEAQRGIGVIERLFHVLANNSEWIETTLPIIVSRDTHIARTVQFYSKKLHALKRSIANKSEMARLYAAIHYNNSLILQLRGDKHKKRFAKGLLLQSQNYYSFMRQEGSRYDPHFQRKHAYSLLIEVSQMIYAEKKRRPTIIAYDCDFDRVKEFLFQNESTNVNIHRSGGIITELGVCRNKWNWLDMSMAERTSHRVFLRSKSDVRAAVLSGCVIDYLFPGTSSLRTFFNSKTHTYSLRNHLYDVVKIDREQSEIQLATATKKNGNGSQGISLDIQKTFQFNRNNIVVNYQVQNNTSSACKAIFATQLNINPSLHHFDEVSIEHSDIASKTQSIAPNKLFARLHESAAVRVSSTQQKHSFTCNCAGSDTLFLYRVWELKAISIIPCWNLLLGPQDSRSFQIIIEINYLNTRVRSQS